MAKGVLIDRQQFATIVWMACRYGLCQSTTWAFDVACRLIICFADELPDVEKNLIVELLNNHPPEHSSCHCLRYQLYQKARTAVAICPQFEINGAPTSSGGEDDSHHV